MNKKENLDDFFEKFYSSNEVLTIQEIRKRMLNLFTNNGVSRSYEKRSSIFRLNDTANEAYFVKSGRVRIYKLTSDGKEVTFQIVNAGEGLGMAELILNRPRIRYAETMCKTNLLVMKKEQIFNMFSADPECFLYFFLAVTQLVLRYQNIVEDLSILSVRERVIKLLLRLCKERTRDSDCNIIDFPITHEEIAQMVGSTRQTITIILNDLRKEGILNWEQKKIKIFNYMGLSDYTSSM